MGRDNFVTIAIETCSTGLVFIHPMVCLTGLWSFDRAVKSLESNRLFSNLCAIVGDNFNSVFPAQYLSFLLDANHEIGNRQAPWTRPSCFITRHYLASLHLYCILIYIYIYIYIYIFICIGEYKHSLQPLCHIRCNYQHATRCSLSIRIALAGEKKQLQWAGLNDDTLVA